MWNVIPLVVVLVDHFVDDRVPIQGLVLLNVAGVAQGIPQISIRDLRSHCELRGCPVEPDGCNSIFTMKTFKKSLFLVY